MSDNGYNDEEYAHLLKTKYFSDENRKVLCITSRAVIAQWLERLHADPVVMYSFHRRE